MVSLAPILRRRLRRGGSDDALPRFRLCPGEEGNRVSEPELKPGPGPGNLEFRYIVSSSSWTTRLSVSRVCVRRKSAQNASMDAGSDHSFLYPAGERARARRKASMASSHSPSALLPKLAPPINVRSIRSCFFCMPPWKPNPSVLETVSNSRDITIERRH